MNNNTIIVPKKGQLPIPMTNDYLFRALLQENNLVLRELIQDLLHLESGSVVSAEITNPIQLGDSIDAKTFILDINVLLNNNSIIDLEMQVINEHNWVERSLAYLCRDYDNLNKGDDYAMVKPVYQIGLLNFTLFEDEPEFFAAYKFMNEKTHRIYSDKLQLYVLDLTQVEMATASDKAHCLDYWAKLFTAKTWEEIHMLEKDKPVIENASRTLYMLSEEENIRLQAQARQDYYRDQHSFHKYYQDQLAAKDAEIEMLKKQLEEAKKTTNL